MCNIQVVNMNPFPVLPSRVFFNIQLLQLSYHLKVICGPFFFFFSSLQFVAVSVPNTYDCLCVLSELLVIVVCVGLLQQI